MGEGPVVRRVASCFLLSLATCIVAIALTSLIYEYIQRIFMYIDI